MFKCLKDQTSNISFTCIWKTFFKETIWTENEHTVQLIQISKVKPENGKNAR